jgi:hypothetical protein
LSDKNVINTILTHSKTNNIIILTLVVFLKNTHHNIVVNK